MAPPSRYEFVILKLTFNPKLLPQNPRIALISKKYSPGNSMFHVRDWFDRVMSLEKSNVPPNLSVRYIEWNITSGNASLFNVRGCSFDKVLLVLGDELVHFVYYHSMPLRKRIEGSKLSTVNFCGCCFNEQYLQIMASIESYVNKQ